MKTIIERGASWTLEETKLLLGLWGQDLVQRQATNTKRTKEVYEKISEKFLLHGFERTADQVRTRVFNMIAEYRRILKDPNPERMKKCIFFEALHKIYQAKHMDDVKSALDDYEPDYPYSPASNTTSLEKGDESVSDGEATDGNETINNATTNTINSNNNNNNTNNNNTATNNSSVNDNNNGDSNNNANTEKESSSTNSHGGGSNFKRMKLEKNSPKSGHDQTNQVTNNMNPASTSMANPSLASASSSSSPTDHTTPNSKQTNKTQVPIVATTIGGASIASTSNSSSSCSSSSAASSSQRHQSLLLPHATTSSATTSTPISKLTTAGSNNTPSYININSAKLPIIRTNQLIGHSNGSEPINLNGTATRLPTTAAITSHQLYQAPVNTFDVTSSALLIDRMFAHLSRESENMREWIALEKERIALERSRRQQETEREVRRERVLIDTLTRFQEQWLSFLSRLNPRIVDNPNETPPELKVPPREASTADTSQSTQASNSTSSTTNSINNYSSNPPSESNKQ